jgi:hypothetical protein
MIETHGWCFRTNHQEAQRCRTTSHTPRPATRMMLSRNAAAIVGRRATLPRTVVRLSGRAMTGENGSFVSSRRPLDGLPRREDKEVETTRQLPRSLRYGATNGGRGSGGGRRCFSTDASAVVTSSPTAAAATPPAPYSSATAVTSSDGVVGEPIDFDVAATIEGAESQIVTIQLTYGQVLRAESGALMYMTDGIEMATSTGGGIGKALSRMMTGQNLFLTDYRYTRNDGTSGTVALGTNFPSKILRLNVAKYGGKLVCQKGALLCASHTIDIQMEYSKNLTTGFFGGEGFILQVRTR